MELKNVLEYKKFFQENTRNLFSVGYFIKNIITLFRVDFFFFWFFRLGAGKCAMLLHFLVLIRMDSDEANDLPFERVH